MSGFAVYQDFTYVWADFLVIVSSMKPRDRRWRGLKPFQRIGVGFIGLTIIATGALALAQGKLHYENAEGLAVFAPFAFIVGALVMVMVFRSGPRR